jgi:hypothetical protein
MIVSSILRRSVVLLASSLFLALQLVPLPASATDPETVVTDLVDQWTVAGGFVYWAYDCEADTECLTDPYLRRVPVNGGDSTTMASASEAPYSFTRLHADDDGAYVYDEVEDRIEMYRTGDPIAAPISLWVTASAPTTRIVSDATHVCWGGATGLYRASKNGSGGAKILNTGTARSSARRWIPSISPSPEC